MPREASVALRWQTYRVLQNPSRGNSHTYDIVGSMFSRLQWNVKRQMSVDRDAYGSVFGVSSKQPCMTQSGTESFEKDYEP